MPWEIPGDPLSRFWVSTDYLCSQWSYFHSCVMKYDCTRIVRNSWAKSSEEIGKSNQFSFFVPRKHHDIADPNEDALFGGSSILSAIDFALKLGCKQVYLLGVDHRNLHGNSHFWQFWPKKYRPKRESKSGDYQPCQRQQKRVFGSNMKVFAVLEKYSKKIGARIYNCSSLSDITVFEKITLSQALEV